MPGRVKVLGGVFVLGRIATAYVTAGEAEPQVYPGIPHLQTLLAAPGVWTYVLDFIQMLAGDHSRSFPRISTTRPGMFIPR
jgi:hypothetical protein